MRILLSNDDGYMATGLQCLASGVEEFGDITVVAPDRNRSGASNSLTLATPLRARRARVMAALETANAATHLSLREGPRQGLRVNRYNFEGVPKPSVGAERLFFAIFRRSQHASLPSLSQLLSSRTASDALKHAYTKRESSRFHKNIKFCSDTDYKCLAPRLRKGIYQA